jgi:hypothetical protein
MVKYWFLNSHLATASKHCTSACYHLKFSLSEASVKVKKKKYKIVSKINFGITNKANSEIRNGWLRFNKSLMKQKLRATEAENSNRTVKVWDFRSSGIIRCVVWYRRFGTTYLSHLQESRSPIRPFKLGPVGRPETSPTNYWLTLRKIPLRANILFTRRRNPEFTHCGSDLCVTAVVQYSNIQNNRIKSCRIGTFLKKT